MGGVNTNGNFNQANNAALFQMQARGMRTQQIAAGVLNGSLNADEFALLATRNAGAGFGRPEPTGGASPNSDVAQAQAIFAQVKADAEGFQKLNNKYTDGDHHPKPKKSERKQFKRTKALFKQLKSGELSPLQLQQKLQEIQGK